MGLLPRVFTSCSSFRRKPESILISILLFSEERSFHSPCGRAGHFLLLRQEKVTKEKATPMPRSPGILPSDYASALRGSLDVRPCTFSERPRIVRGLLRTDPAHPRRATGGPVWAASCRRSQSQSRSQSESESRSKSRRQSFPFRHLEVVQGCTDSWINGAVRGAEDRRRGGKMPAGSRRWIAALAKQHRDVLSEQPGAGEKRRGF